MGRSKTKEKNYCKILYVDKRLSVSEILEREDVEISERTLRKWVNDPVDNWDKLRKSFLTTRQNQITLMYDQLEWLNNDIPKREIKVATSKEADTISKITTAIKRLEIEASIGEIIEVGRMFIDFAKDVDFAKAKDITTLYDQFIQSKIK